MKCETLISLMLGIPIGVVTGLYSGIIVSRYSRFAELRNQLLRIIRTIDYMEEQSRVDITNDQDVGKIDIIISDLFFLKHKKAGEKMCSVLESIYRMKMLATSGKINVLQYEEYYLEWQKVVQSLTPNKFILFSLWSKL
jgi:hypothetical protein